MPYPNKDDNEIRLFGDKSIREEAYHKKILQLEKEIANLETLAKGQEDTDYIKSNAQPKNLNNLYYESLLSFDRKIKKEQEFLEKRATEITERLDIQAQRLIMDVENSFRRKTKWVLFIVVALVLPFVIFLAYSNTALFSNRLNIQQPASLNAKISYIKTALQTQTKYHHQYKVNNINVLDGSYIVEVELDTASNDSWFFRSLAQDVVRVFQKYSSNSPAEISFFRNGKLYIKAYLTASTKRPYLQYFF